MVVAAEDIHAMKSKGSLEAVSGLLRPEALAPDAQNRNARSCRTGNVHAAAAVGH